MAKFNRALLVDNAGPEDFDRLRSHVISLSPIEFVAIMNSGIVTAWVRKQFTAIERRKAVAL